MKRNLVVAASLVLFAAACEATPEPAAPPPPEPPPPATASAAAPPPPVETAKPAEPSPEEKKKAEAALQLEKDRAKMEADDQAERARYTDELKAAAKALTSKAFPNGKAAIQAAVASKHRKPGHADRDQYRHPVETLDFFGLKPNMTVIEYGPGEGWFTELLAPALAPKGKLFITSTDPNGPITERSTYYGQLIKHLLDRQPEIFGKVETIVIDGKNPHLGHEGKADMVLILRGLHGMVNNGRLDTWLAEVHSALKPKGILGIEQHRANADAKAEEASKKGYLPEKWVIEKIEAAGFKLAGKSEVNANPKDTKDYPEGVWTLPPTLELGDRDRAKYLAIGESDRMTLKFVKVDKKAEKKK
jgi:predicted methyltransferase